MPGSIQKAAPWAARSASKTTTYSQMSWCPGCVSNSAYADACRPSLDFQFGGVDHTSPFLHVVPDQRRIGLGRARDRLQRIGRQHLLAVFGIVEDALHFRIYLDDNVTRRGARREQAEPGLRLEAR